MPWHIILPFLFAGIFLGLLAGRQEIEVGSGRRESRTDEGGRGGKSEVGSRKWENK